MPEAVAQLPNAPGVYRFLDARRHVLYIGRATRLRSRVGSYWTNLGDRPGLRRMVARIAHVEALMCASEHEAAWLERNLLTYSLPRWNRTSGTEVPVFIRLDDRRSAPGLAVVHEVLDPARARHFGPYLGGHKVRLAVSGLRRVLPLAYAGAAIGGFGRDMARIRGVDPEDRLALVDAITSVLDRDPAAVAGVRAELVRQRDRAADRLAFELAAEVHAEIEALEWVIAEQKVANALSGPLDYDVHAWAGGVLVQFEVRGGYLCSWRTRSCSKAAAQSLVAASPRAWSEFARRNAEIAARLNPYA